MKSATLVIVCLFTMATHAQSIKKEAAFYAQRSQTQKTIAWVALTTGTASIITGAVIPRGEKVDYFFWDTYENSDTKIAFFTLGTVSVLTSFFLFGSASKNERKAMELSFKPMETKQIMRNGFANVQIPSVALRVRL